jgi:hypothetical protein
VGTAQRKTGKCYTGPHGAYEVTNCDFHETMTNEEEVSPEDWLIVKVHFGQEESQYMVDKGERLSHNLVGIAKQIKTEEQKSPSGSRLRNRKTG